MWLVLKTLLHKVQNGLENEASSFDSGSLAPLEEDSAMLQVKCRKSETVFPFQSQILD